jgi:hypothetical protein
MESVAASVRLQGPAQRHKQLDDVGRLIEAKYSTSEQFECAYDKVDNHTAMRDTTRITTYQCGAANRLTSVGGVTYTWDDQAT